MPKAKQLIAGASFGPTKVAQLARVFDEAWDLVTSKQSIKARWPSKPRG